MCTVRALLVNPASASVHRYTLLLYTQRPRLPRPPHTCLHDESDHTAWSPISRFPFGTMAVNGIVGRQLY